MKAIIPGAIKSFVKKYFWSIVFHKKISEKADAANSAFLVSQSIQDYQRASDFNIFTNGGEDGILLFLLSKINALHKTFIDIGSNDCINSNFANLAFHHNWKGVFIDAEAEALNRGKYIYKKHFKEKATCFSFIHSLVTPENINDLLLKADPEGNVDLLSIDLDGNDYFVWKAMNIIQPKIVVTEVQIEKGGIDFIPEYTHGFERFESGIPKGASPLSMTILALEKGYELVAANKKGYNLFFVRKDCMTNLKSINVTEMLKDSKNLN
jgi:hypothetical protein